MFPKYPLQKLLYTALLNAWLKPRLHCGVHVWRLPALGGGCRVAMKRQENRQWLRSSATQLRLNLMKRHETPTSAEVLNCLKLPPRLASYYKSQKNRARNAIDHDVNGVVVAI